MRWDKETLYLAAPTLLQHALCSLEGWRINRRRYGNTFHALLEDYQRRNDWDANRLRGYRDRRLREFVRFCEATVPYYRRQFRQLGMTSRDVRTLDDLRCLPVLTKQTVQERREEFLSEAIPPRRRLMVHTSGSTGSGLRFAATAEALAEQWAVWWRYRRRLGIPLDTWCGYFGGRSIVPLRRCKPPFWRYNLPGRQIFFSGYHISPQNLDAYITQLGRRQPPWLHGYPSLLSLLASHVLQGGQGLGYQVQWITVGAENLLPQQAVLIEKAFGVPPMQHYGLAEAVANISQCEDGRLRVDEDFAAVEFLPNPSGPGYKIIGTNFSNPATPLLRYDTGDLVALPAGRAADQHRGRIVERIDGRQEDYVVLKNGACLGRMDHVFKDCLNVREAQIRQQRPGHMVFHVVRGPDFTQRDERLLIAETRKRVGSEADFEIVYVDHIPRTKTGKLRFVVSSIQEQARKAA